MNDTLARSWVTLEGVSVDLGIEANQVLKVVRRSDWAKGVPVPLELTRCLGWLEKVTADDQARVLVVHSARGDAQVGVGGKIRLRVIEEPALMSLPPEVLIGPAGQLLTAVVLEEGKSPLLVLSPEGLWRLSQQQQTREEEQQTREEEHHS